MKSRARRGVVPLALILVVAIGSALFEPRPAQAAERVFLAQLAASQVAPAATSPVAGFAEVRFDPETNQGSYLVRLFGVSPNQVTSGHLHRGGRGANGEVLVTLIQTSAVEFAGRFGLQSFDATNLLNGNSYLEVHTVSNPDGAARGQLLATGLQPTPAVALPVLQPTVVVEVQSATSTGVTAAGPRGAITPPSTGDAGLK